MAWTCQACKTINESESALCVACGISVTKNAAPPVEAAPMVPVAVYERASPLGPGQGPQPSGQNTSQPPAPARQRSRLQVVIGLVVALVVAALCGFGAAKLAASSAGPTTTTTVPARSSTTRATTTDPTTTTPDASAALVEKTGTGEYTVRFTHPTWGQVRLVTRQRGDDLALGAGEGAQPGEISMAVLDDEGQELWFSSTDDGYLLHPAGVDGDASASVTSPMDDAGNIFVEYFAGRSAGVVVLRPTANGMEDFGSLPDDLRFAGQYDARVEDSDSDGVYEIAVDFNPCDPSCADGGLVTAIYRWNGSDFESSLPPAETVEPPLPGSPCTVGSSPDCIDPDGTGTGTYLSGGADCMATFAPDSTDLCNDYDGDGKAGFPDGGGD